MPAAADLAADYQYLFHHLPDSYLLLAPDGTVRDNSDLHQQASLQPRATVVGRNIFAAYPSAPESQRTLNESQDRVRHTLQPDTMPLLRYDLDLPAAQGGGTQELYWEVTHYPILGPDGTLLHILQRATDVTAATRAAAQAADTQRALDETRTRTQFILESLPLQVWTTTPAGQADFFNSRWTDFTGRTLADTLGNGWAQDLHPDDLPRTYALWQQALATGEPFQGEYRVRRHDGQYRWFQAMAVPRRGPSGDVQMWVGANADIHQQKLMVAELLEANETQATLADQAYTTAEQVQQQRETLFQVFMDAPLAVAVVRGSDYRYEFVNRRFLMAMGQVNVVGRTVAEAFPGLVAQGYLTPLAEVYRTGQPFSAREVLLQLPATAAQPARDIYIDYTYQPFFEDGRVAGATSFSYNVTELVTARRTLENLGLSAAKAS
ncbi:PAS domain-containing protein [Hymenobacter nivis]|uniref:histidine kinase n=1 Tax=Hymenobacter nivis TaxID=1850093 RepID=A0A502GWA2_9BACT|nr:PAS domain-containing protein [Hymenobacter nivis]TPG66687.1 PAS domain S-box protein [Hymenobacter nivis]